MVLAMAGKDPEPWFKRAKLVERDAPDRAGSAERALEWAKAYADKKTKAESAVKARDNAPDSAAFLSHPPGLAPPS